MGPGQTRVHFPCHARRPFTGSVHPQLCATTRPLPKFGTQVRIGINATIPQECSSHDVWGDIQPLHLSCSHCQVILQLDKSKSWIGLARCCEFQSQRNEGKNAVWCKAPVTSAFGKDDVRSVNLTIVDPSGNQFLAQSTFHSPKSLQSLSLSKSYPYVAGGPIHQTYRRELPGLDRYRRCAGQCGLQPSRSFLVSGCSNRAFTS